jgi:hypothetical protein
MASGSSAGKRWVEILGVLRTELPGEWSLRGGGLKALLVAEPIAWANPWIGASKASSVRMHAGVAPALAPVLAWPLGVYGIDMSEAPTGLRALPLGEEGDLDVARGFAAHAMQRIGELTPARFAEWAEAALRDFRDGKPPTADLAMAPGWRVVNDTGDPVDAAQACLDFAGQHPPDAGWVAPYVAFFEALIAAWEQGGRESALKFLVGHRDRQLAEQGYGGRGAG